MISTAQGDSWHRLHHPSRTSPGSTRKKTSRIHFQLGLLGQRHLRRSGEHGGSRPPPDPLVPDSSPAWARRIFAPQLRLLSPQRFGTYFWNFILRLVKIPTILYISSSMMLWCWSLLNAHSCLFFENGSLLAHCTTVLPFQCGTQNERVWAVDLLCWNPILGQSEMITFSLINSSHEVLQHKDSKYWCYMVETQWPSFLLNETT